MHPIFQEVKNWKTILNLIYWSNKVYMLSAYNNIMYFQYEHDVL
jgi:hypothetical protein